MSLVNFVGRCQDGSYQPKHSSDEVSCIGQTFGYYFKTVRTGSWLGNLVFLKSPVALTTTALAPNPTDNQILPNDFRKPSEDVIMAHGTDSS
jgi:hypothetical protein